MIGLSLSLLGHFATTLNDRPVTKFRTKRVQALMAYLVTESDVGGMSHQREALMELLWPGMPPKSARTNLRQTLYYLRQAIDDLPGTDGQDPIPFLLADRVSVQINPAYPASSDVTDLGRLLKGSQDSWPEAIALYRGDFLADFYLPDANLFEEWAGSQRAAYRRQVLGALDTLTADRLAHGDFDEAESYALRQLEIDDLRESAYRQLMQLYAWSGRQSEALNLYQECLRQLDEELDSPPDETTTALYEAIREKQLPPPPVKPELLVQPAPEEPVGLPASPYRGLFSFREEDALYFFGRESFVERLVDTAKGQPLVAVIGPSGSGKSSVLHAGLITRLQQGDGWVIASFRPGNQPYRSLAAALLPILEPEMTETDRLVEIRKMALALEEGFLPLNDVVDRIVGKNPRTRRLLLVADHFEELYTSSPDMADRRQFLESLMGAIGSQQFRSDPTFCFTLAVRADFLGHVLAYRPFADAFQDASLILGPMNREELGRAIEKPAGIQGVSFESGLVERILADVGDEPGNLPLLEFALTTLWERQSDRQLTHADYESTGKVEGALTRYADEVYEGLSQEEQDKARHVFVQLVRPGQQSVDSRRLSRRVELGEENWALAQRLADARLVVIDWDPAGQETVELAHETLIRRWGRLRMWLEENRAFRFWQERLRAALHQWQASDRDEGALLRGVPLDEAEIWLVERRDQLSQAEIDFIEASCALRDRLQAERERQQAEREQAQLVRERTRRWITVGLAAGLLIAVALLTLAAWQWNSARQAREVAEAQRDQTQNTLSSLLASQAELLLEDQPDLAQLLAVEAFNINDSPETRGSLLTAVSHLPQLRSSLYGHADQVRALAITPDGRTLASAGDENTIQLWDLSTGQALGPPLAGHTDTIWSLAFSPDSRLLASGSFDDSAILWELATGLPLGSPLSGHTNNVWILAFSPDGELVASGSADGTIRLWDVATGQQVGAHLTGHGGTVATLAFSPDGRLLVSGGRDGSVLLWELLDPDGMATIGTDDPAARQLGLPLTGHDALVRALTFSPDGRILATGGHDKSILLWDLSPAKEALDQGQDATAEAALLAELISGPISGHDDLVTSLAFGSDESTLASAGADGRVILWDISPALNQGGSVDKPASQILVGHGEPVWSLAFGPDGRTLVTGGANGRITLWNADGQHPLIRQFAGSDYAVSSVALSPDGQTLAVSDDLGVTRIWDIGEENDSVIRVLEPTPRGLLTESTSGDLASIRDSTFSPDGRLLATGSDDGVINLWDIRAKKLITSPLTAHTSFVWDLSFSPDGRVLTSISQDGTIRFWDGGTGRSLAPPLTGQFGRERAVVFSPQGDLIASTAGGKVTLWEVEPFGEEALSDKEAGDFRTPIQRFGVNTYPTLIPAVAFNPDGRTLVAGGTDGRITLLDVASGEPIDKPPIGHEGEIWGVAFTPDGETMVTASNDGQIIVWDVDKGSATFGRPYGPPIAGPWLRDQPRIAFSQDALKIAATGEGRTVVLYDVDVKSWLSIACQRANRNLTMEEWRQFFGDEPYRLTCPDLPSGADSGA
jgi:WD40 repeat protein/DNA-binding SARP family transcriptional activator